MTTRPVPLQPHHRQFVVARGSVSVPAHWVDIPLVSDYVLHVCPDKSVTGDGTSLFIGEVARAETVIDALDLGSASGRFAMIDGPLIRSDAAAVLGLYISTFQGSTLVSSSAAMLASITGAPRLRRELGWYSFNWHPLPCSGFEGIHKLLPGDVLDFTSGVTTVSPLTRPHGGSIDERAEVVADELVAAVQALGSDRPVRVSLTAGLDSRTVFSAALAAAVDLSTYTTGEPGQLDGADLRIARELAARAGVHHEEIVLDEIDKDRRRAIDEHTAGESHDADYYFVPRGGYGSIAADELVLRGGAFEFGRRFFGDVLAHLSFEEVLEDPSKIFERTRIGPLAKTVATPQMRAWAQRRAAQELPVSWIDQFYLDQRVAGWLAGIEQLLDIRLASSVHLASNQQILAAVVGDPGEPAVGEQVQRAVIRRLAPQLGSVEINPTEPPSGRFSAEREKLKFVRRVVESEARGLRRGRGRRR